MKPIEILPKEYQEKIAPYQRDNYESNRDASKALSIYVAWGHKSQHDVNNLCRILYNYEEINHTLLIK